MMTTQRGNILLSGVGGQGVLLIAELVARAAMRAGCDVKKTEVHGAAQRGGSVVSHVRYAPRVFSPLIPAGEADILVSLEQLEGLRWAHYLRPGGTIALNTEVRVPASIDGKPVEYPEGIPRFLEGRGFIVKSADAHAIAVGLGNHRAANIVLLGLVAVGTGFGMGLWIDTIRDSMPSRFVDLNLAAFEQGARAAGSATGGTAVC